MKVLKLCDFRMASELSNIRNCVNNIVNFIFDCHGHLKEDVIFELKVVLNELLQNAIRHGNKEVIEKQVKIRVGVNDNDVYFIIEDEGEGFVNRCSGQQDPLLDMCDMKESGRGLLIVRNLCEKVKYNAKGNKVVVLKKLE
ncbi:MAG: Anti-sigma F factor [Firmicutes bacterium ADurb.Bin419]|nr:MAG: Anti-sigma F factor [Firmicutes bacterium ADurb.Bin419]